MIELLQTEWKQISNEKLNTETKEVKDIKLYTESEYGRSGINWNQNNLPSIQ